MKGPYICLMLATIGAPLEAAAQTAVESVAGSDARSLRRDARLTVQDLTELRARPAPPGIDWKLTLGLATTDAENGGKRWATPFQLRARFNEGRTAFKLSGDGYSHLHAQSRTTAGITDLNAIATQLVTEDLLAEVGVTLPARGEAGSSAGRERIGLAYNRVLSRHWEAQVRARLVRYDTDPRPGVSRIRRQGLVQVAYNFDAPHTDLLFQLLRNYRPGSSSASQAAIIYEFPLEQKRRPAIGAIGFTRGLSPHVRDNTLEFDVSVRF